MRNGTLLGRERELAVLTDLIDAADRAGSTLLVRGDAGIGKSRLLAAAGEHARARGLLVLSTIGVQSESHLPFAALHQLLQPVMDRAGDLPGPQRDALLSAFGMSAGAGENFFFTALAALNLLADSAAGAPILVLVDDLQWVDQPTSEVLAFIARRVEAEPLVLVAAARTGTPRTDEPDLPELPLTGIDDESAQRLLDERAPQLAAGVRQRLLAESAGNPLALIELPEAIRSEGLDHAPVLPPMLPLTTRLERAFAARTAGLPPQTRRLLLAATLDDGRGTLDDVLEAGADAGERLTAEALQPAVRAGLLVTKDGRLGFHHPLVRSAVYGIATPAERHRAHTAWARVLDGQPDRQIWHRASAATAPDERLAAELDEIAGEARRRGAVARAVAAQERAAQLTPDPGRRCGRLLDAAELAFDAGQHVLMGRLVADAARLPAGPGEAARIAWLRSVLDDGEPGDTEGLLAMVAHASTAVDRGEPELALQLLIGAARRCWWHDPGPAARQAVLAAIRRLPTAETDPRLLAALGICEPIGQGGLVISRLNRIDPGPSTDVETVELLCLAAYVCGDFLRADSLAVLCIERLRAQGRLAILAQVLTMRASACVYLGTWQTAASAAAEGGRLARETGQPVWAAAAASTAARMEALRQEPAHADAHISTAEAAGRAARAGSIAAALATTRGILAFARGDNEEAWTYLRRVFDPDDDAHHRTQKCWMLGHLAEIASQTGHRDEALAVLRDIEPLTGSTDAPALLIGIAYARAVLSTDDDREKLFQEAYELTPVRWPFERARLELAHGTWLRRHRRIAESRAPLRAARERFDRIGAASWGARARKELRAAGESSRQAEPGSWERLTPQEFQIASMAADGLSNREISQRLYLSYRTVGSHLYRIFPKLGITSRAQLRDALRRE